MSHLYLFKQRKALMNFESDYFLRNHLNTKIFLDSELNKQYCKDMKREDLPFLLLITYLFISVFIICLAYLTLWGHHGH